MKLSQEADHRGESRNLKEPEVAKPHQLARRSTTLPPDSQEHNHEHRYIQTGSTTNLAKARVFLRTLRGVLMTLPLPCHTEHFLGGQAGFQSSNLVYL